MRHRYTPTESFSKTIKILFVAISVVLFTMNVSFINVLAQQSGSVTTGPAKSGNASTGPFMANCSVQGACVFGPATSGSVTTGTTTSGPATSLAQMGGPNRAINGSNNPSTSGNEPNSTAGNIVNFDNWQYSGITSGNNWQYIGQTGAVKTYTKGDCTYIVNADHPLQNIFRCNGNWPP